MPAFVGVLDRDLAIRPTHGLLTDQAAAAGIRVTVLHHTNADDDAFRVLANYQRGGAEAVHLRAQDCAVVLFDAEAQALVLSRDTIGMNPIYYMERHGRFIFGSRVWDLLQEAGGPALPDLSSLATLAVAGAAPTGGATYFQGIAALPPGCTLIRQQGRTQLLPAATLTGSGDADEFSNRFMASVARRTSSSSPTAVFVSGGLDSAAIISSIDPDAAFGITYGLQDGSVADESEYIDLLRAAGQQIDRVDFYPITDLASIESNIRHAEEPLADDVPATLLRAAAHARGRGADVLLLGTWGDQVLAPFPPPHLRRVAPWRLLELATKARRFQRSLRDIEAPFILRALIRQSVHERIPEALLRARRRARLRANAFDHLLEHLPPQHPTPPILTYADAVRAGALAPDQTQAIEGVVKWGWGSGLEVRVPFLDRSLLQLLLNIKDEQAYRDDSLKPLLRDAMRGRVPDRLLDRGDKGDYTSAIGRAMLPVRAIVAALDRLERIISFGLMSEAAAEKTLARLNNRREMSDADIALAGLLLGLDVWLRTFCKGDHGKAG